MSDATAIRVYEIGRGKSDNIALVDKLMLVVNSIDERENKVWFVANPSTVECQAVRALGSNATLTNDRDAFEAPNRGQRMLA